MSGDNGGIVSKYALKQVAIEAGTYVAPVQENSAPDVHPNAPMTYDPSQNYWATQRAEKKKDITAIFRCEHISLINKTRLLFHQCI